MSEIYPVHLPDRFYVPRYSRCGFEIRDRMPWDVALAYVTDGVRFGVQFKDGSIDWLIQPEGNGTLASDYRIAREKLPAGLRIDSRPDEIVLEIWRENSALLTGLRPARGR